MGKKMTWEEMKNAYPDEWVAISNVEGDVDTPFGNISGEVIIHDADEAAFTAQLKKKSFNKTVDIRFTGEVLPDNPVGPILWQISDTNS